VEFRAGLAVSCFFCFFAMCAYLIHANAETMFLSRPEESLVSRSKYIFFFVNLAQFFGDLQRDAHGIL
jgi:hypothetical protein